MKTFEQFESSFPKVKCKLCNNEAKSFNGGFCYQHTPSQPNSEEKGCCKKCRGHKSEARGVLNRCEYVLCPCHSPKPEEGLPKIPGAKPRKPGEVEKIMKPLKDYMEAIESSTHTSDEWEKEFIEKGADLEHNRWARWQKYFFSKCSIGIPENDDYVEFRLPRNFYDRWKRQIDTPYSELSEEEKESDRKETRNYLPLLSTAIKTREEEIVEMIKGKKFVMFNECVTAEEVAKKANENLDDIINKLVK